MQLKESRESLAVQSWNKIKKYDQPRPDYLFPPLKDSIGFCLPRLRMVLLFVIIISKTLSCKWEHSTTCTFCLKLVQLAFAAHCMPIIAWSRTFEDCPLTYLVLPFPRGSKWVGELSGASRDLFSSTGYLLASNYLKITQLPTHADQINLKPFVLTAS